MKNLSLFVVAGEASGDKLGAPIIETLKKMAPHLTIQGVAGPKLRNLGLIASVQMEELQVMGFFDVIKALFHLGKRFFRIRKEILQLNPKAVLCIDYPGFNLRLESSLRKKGYRGKIIHLVCPTVWAWGKKRIPQMAQTLDHLLTLFPFEKECFAKTTLPVTFIGHPLALKTKAHTPFDAFYSHYKLDPQQKILALFPGSRKSVIDKNLPLQLEAAKGLKSHFPDLQIVLSLPHPQNRSQLRAYAPKIPLIEPEHLYDLCKNTHLALATSGTITLELALLGTPTVVQYKIAPLDVFLAKRVFRIDLPYYSIVNILMKKRVFPELFGPNLTLDALLDEMRKLWQDREECLIDCQEVQKKLGDSSSDKIAAEVLLSNLA